MVHSNMVAKLIKINELSKFWRFQNLQIQHTEHLKKGNIIIIDSKINYQYYLLLQIDLLYMTYHRKFDYDEIIFIEMFHGIFLKKAL